MEQEATLRVSRVSSHDKRILAIVFTILAVLSPLYIDRRSMPDPEEEEPIDYPFYLPVLLVILITAIVVSSYSEHGFTSFDPYWIHRVGGSSTGIVIVLIVLTFVLKCKSCAEN